MKEILDEIKEAEKKKKDIAKYAEIKKEEIIQKARQDSLKLISEKEAELDEEFRKEVDKKTAELDKKKREISLKAEKEAEQLEKESIKKKKNAVNHIMDKFEEFLR